MTSQLHTKHIYNSRFHWVWLFMLNFLLFPINSNSQIKNYSVENLFVDEGFPVIRIFNISQDNDGLIWICSERKLHTFNGSQFELKLDFTKINFYPKRVYFDNNGNKWLQEFSKLVASRYNTSLERVKIFNKANQEIDVEEYIGFDGASINKLDQKANGEIIIQNGKSFYSFDKKISNLDLPKGTKSYAYSDNEIYLINNEKGSIVLDQKNKNTLYSFDNLKAYKVRLYKDVIYILFTDGSFRMYDKTTNQGSLISNSLLNHELLSDFLFDSNGDIWIIKRRKISIYNLDKKQEVELTSDNPSIPYYTSVLYDQEKNMWLGTNLGINKLTKKKKAFFESPIDFNYSTRNITQISDEEIFISTYSGDFIYNLKKSSSTKIKDFGVILEMIKNNEHYYAINKKNILSKRSLIDNEVINEVQFPRKYKEGRHPGSLLKTTRGQMFLILNHYVIRFDSDLNHQIVAEDKSNTIFFHEAYEKDGKIYLSTSKGIYQYDENFNLEKQFLNEKNVHLIHKDRENKNILWISSTVGLIKYDSEQETYEIYDTSRGFLNTSFTAIVEDENGNLWLPSFAGLNKFNKRSLENQVFFAEDGLSNNEFNNNSFLKLKDGRYVFGSISGLTILDPMVVNIEADQSKPVQIYSCQALSSSASDRINLTKEIRENSILEFKEKYIETEIKLSHYSYSNLKAKLFRYRIYEKNKGTESDTWVNLMSNVIQLGRFPYGEYILEFGAVSRNGEQLSNTEQIEVHYIRPWHKTLVARLVGIGSLIFGFYYFSQKRSQALIAQKVALETEVSFRTQQIQKQKQELENLNSTKDKLFSILAHDLKSPLITLKNISGKINYLIEKKQPERIIEIGKTIEDKVSNLNNFLDNLLNWSLQQRGHLRYKPKTLNIQDITEEIIILYEDLVQDKNLIIKQDIPMNSTCYADEDSLKTVIRNIIHNAIKYSPSGNEIAIKYSRDGEYNILAISDKGKGIPQSVIDAIYKKEYIKNTLGTNGEKGTGLGFMISKELMDLNKGKLVFLTNKDRGTTVELLLPIEA